MEGHRIILHIDMDAFFASVEQRCRPGLRDKPVAVIGSGTRTVITTSSYQARGYGVKTGMTIYEARKKCPTIHLVIGNNRKYIDTSCRIVKIFQQFTPIVEVYSIDEAFLDITGSIPLFESPEAIATGIKSFIRNDLGLTCSIGIAPNKLLAKLAFNFDLLQTIPRQLGPMTRIPWICASFLIASSSFRPGAPVSFPTAEMITAPFTLFLAQSPMI